MAKTIGLLIDQLVYEYQAEMWHGVCYEARNSDVNLVTYVGNTIDYNDKSLINHNKLYELISEKRIQGAIVLISSVSSHVDRPAKTAFMKGIAEHCPVVSVGDIFDEFASIGVDNRKGMYDSVTHLIVKHGKKKIAFIGGPAESDEAQIRFDAYREALEANSITYDENLYFPGKFVFASGLEAIQYFVENNTAFDAVVAASDWMAFGALQELKHHGFDVPGKIAVSGFDNVESTYVSSPPMSSVKQPVYEMGRKAVETIISILEKRPYEKKTIYATEHIIRDSCGCVLEQRSDSDEKDGNQSGKAARYNELKAELTDAVKLDINGGKQNFLNRFNQALDKITRTEDIPEYHKMITEIHDDLLNADIFSAKGSPTYKKNEKHHSVKFNTVDDILNELCSFTHLIEGELHKARTMISRKAEQLQFIKYLNSNNMSSQIISIGQHLLTTYNRDYMFSVIERDFPKVDIRSCAIVEYTEPEAEPFSRESRMIYYYNRDRNHKQHKEPFDTKMLVPDAYWPSPESSPWSVNIIPINYKNSAIGYVFFESMNLYGLLFESFSSEIASALKGIEVFEEHEKVSVSISERSRKINSLVAPMLESLRQIANQTSSEAATISNLGQITASGLEKLKSSNEIIEKASTSINQMLNLINMIEDLSSNINILALNASIESARAGTYGLGFQVIAEEIKQLSDSTAQNTKSISEVLRSVINSIEESNEASQENYKAFSDVKDHVVQVTGLLIDVKNKMTELSEASSEILLEIEKKI